MNRPQTVKLSAFTLIELLVSITILSALLLIVYTIFSQTSRIWVLSEARTETFQTARLAIEMLSRDLESAIVGTNNLPSPNGKAITFLTFEDANNSPSLATGQSNIKDTPPNDQIFFVGNASDTVRQTYLDLTEYGYFVAFATTNWISMAGPAYYLLRHRVRSDPGTGYDFFSDPTGWYKTPSLSSDHKVPLVDNVLRLELRYEKPDTSASPAPQGTCVLDDWYVGLGTCTAPASPRDTLPRAVHITMCVLDRRSASRLYAIVGTSGLYSDDLAKLPDNIESIPDFAYGDRGAALRNIFREGLRTFYRTVYLRNAQ